MIEAGMHALYLDPAVVSGFAVFIGSIAIAIGTTVVIFYRRAKKKVAEVLHIDENAGKEVEDELVILDEDESQN